MFCLLALFALASALAWGSLTKGHGWGDDFASYIMQARSILELDTRSFVDANRLAVTNHETSQLTLPVAYPWGAPLMLAPFYAGFGLDIHALKIPNVACFLIFLLALSLLIRGYHSGVGTLFVVAVFSTSPLLLSELNRIGSDVPFLCVSTISMLLIDSTVVRRRRLITEKWDACILGLCLTTSICLRPNGWLLVLTLLFVHAVKFSASRRSIDNDYASNVETRSRGPLYLPYIFGGGVLLLWNVIFPLSISRLSAMPLITSEILKDHIVSHFLLPVQFFFGLPYFWIFYIGLLGLVVVGVRASWARTPHFIFYCATTLVILVFWPFYQGVRLILPIIPFFFHFMLEGVRAVRSGLGQRWVRLFDVVSLSVGVFLIGSLCLTSVAEVQRNLRDQRMPSEGPFAKEAQEMFHFISTQTAPDDVIVFFKPRLMRLLTGRRSFESSARSASDQGGYICFYKGFVEGEGGGQLPQELFDDLIQQGRIQPVFVNDQFIVGKANSPQR